MSRALSGPAGTIAALLSTPGPAVGVEIASRRVTAIALGPAGARPVVAAHASEPLAPGAVTPDLNGPNVRDPQAVAAALRRVVERLGGRQRRIGLVLPDSAARVSIVRFEKVPPRTADLERLIHWQVRKSTPFRIEEAQVAWTRGGAVEGAQFVVAVMRRDLVAEYETACAAAGLRAGLVDLASFNLINAILAGSAAVDSASGPGDIRRGDDRPQGDWLLVHLTADYSTLAIVRAGQLIFFRNRPAEGEGGLADLVHQTAMYYEDRLGGGGFTRVVLAGAAETLGAEAGMLKRNLEERIGTRVEALDPRGAAALTDRIDAGPGLLDAIAAPLGLLLRERLHG
jgi:type IV pilus assembly protein PilM